MPEEVGQTEGGKMRRITIFIGLLLFCLSLIPVLYKHYPLRFREAEGITCRLWPGTIGYGSCARCGRTWNICENHTTDIDAPFPGGATLNGHDVSDSVRWGIFVLCKECWRELTPIERLPYYEKHVRRWYPELMGEIRKAVLNEENNYI